MGLERYRSVEEMPPPPVAGDALAGLAAACALSAASALFGHDQRLPRGVARFRSVEEAAAERLRHETAGQP